MASCPIERPPGSSSETDWRTMARRDITGAVDFAYLETYAAGDAALVEEVLGLFRHQAELWMPLLDPAAGGAGLA